MIDNQLSIQPAAGIVIPGKLKTGIPDSAAGFYDLLLSVMPGGGFCHAESADIDSAESITAGNASHSDEKEECFELFYPGVPIHIPADTEDGAVEKQSGGKTSKAPQSQEETEPADHRALTIPPVFAFAGFGFSDIRAVTGGEDAFPAIRTSREPALTNLRAAEQAAVDFMPQVISDAEGNEIQPPEFPADFMVAETVPAEGINSEIRDNKSFSGVAGDDFTGIIFSPLKKTDGSSDDLPETPETGGKKSEISVNRDAARFEARIAEYTSLAAKTEKTDTLRVRHDSELASQLSEGIKAGAEKSDASLFRLKLKPDGLGEVMIKLSRKPDRLEVEISAELSSTKELISKELDTLRVRLNADIGEKPYQFASVTVEYDSHGKNISFSGGQFGRGGNGGNYGGGDGYRSDKSPDVKTEISGGTRYGTRLIDCTA